MGLIDLKIEHIRASKHWNERNKRLKQLRTARKPEIASTSGPTNQQQMDPELYEAAKNGDVDNFITALEKFSETKNLLPLITIFSQLTSEQNTFLHVAASFGHEELTGFIATHFKQLFIRKNHKGDSALHLATRAGHIGVVDVLVRLRENELYRNSIWDDDLVITDEGRVELIKQRVEERVLVNDEGNTALHEALIHDHKDVAECLIRWNVEAACYVNKQGKSPLYMAVEAGNLEYVKKMLLRKSSYMDLLDEQLTKGKSLLHAAITGRNIAMLEELAKRKPVLIHVKDEDGQSPLDFASSIGFLEGVNYLEDEIKKEALAINGNAVIKKAALAINGNAVIVSANQELHKHPPDLKIEDIRQSEHWEGRHRRLSRILDAKKFEKLPQGTQQDMDQHSAELELYIATKKGDVDGFINALKKIVEGKNSRLQIIHNQLTPLQNTLLHVAASFGNEDLTGFIVHHFRSLIKKRNHKGDTALHVAARAGHLGVVDILVRFHNDQMRKDSLLDLDIESNDEKLIGKLKERVVVNDEGNTPLHEALINNHEKVAEYLIKANIAEAYYVNKQGKSALYMAVESENVKCVKTILNTMPSYADQSIIDEEVAKGKSLIHATITGRNIVLLQEIAKMKPSVIHVKDENGQNTLHCAASTGFLEGLDFLINKFKVEIFEMDANGFFPILLASKNGHVGILEKLLQHCPDAREFLNQDGQNVLHVAAKYGKDSVVRYILKTPGLEMLLNEKDKDGNTPLHLATINWHPKVVTSLTWDRRVNLKLVNNEGLTALGAAEEYMEAMASYRKRLTWMALKSAGAPRSKLRKTDKIDRLNSAKYEPYNMDYCKDRVNTLLLVSTLVATVTFAAGFTMPGGYNSSDPDQGMATLLSKNEFQVFVICDTIAMYSAIMVAVTLIWAQLGDLTLVLNALRLAIPLLGISLTMMSLAFMVSVYLVVSKLAWLADLVLIMGIISITSLLALFVPLILPYTSHFPISSYITYYPLCLLMLASGSYYDPYIEDDAF